MNKVELLDSIFKGLSDEMDVSRQTLKTIIEVLFDQIKKTLDMGHPARLSGLGTLTVKSVPAREGRNPGTGETVQIPAKRKVTFKPSKPLKEFLNPE